MGYTTGKDRKITETDDNSNHNIEDNCNDEDSSNLNKTGEKQSEYYH